jgi:Protein of unknown function (DUF3237)
MSDRRSFLSTAALGLASGLPGLVAAAEQTPASPPAGARVPKFEFVYECNATLSPAVEMGKTVEGQRRIIPITGGTVRGPKIQAELLNGGWDWNLSRNDGAGSVEAAYYMKTDDGVLIRIVNKGVGGGGPPSAPSANGEAFFMFTHPEFEAPTGKYDWMNRAMFVGTLGARRDVRNAVLIRVFQVV